MSFDYDAKNEIDVSFVADAIRSSHRLAPLTDEQKLQRQIEREIRREEQAWLAEERRIERERQQAEAEAIAKKEAAIAAEQARQKVQREFRERARERQREQQLVGLHIRAKQQELRQSNVEAAARNVVAQRQRQTLMGELEKMLTPPEPRQEPITEVVVVEEDQGPPKLGYPDLHRWF